jgi:hypothetical protein
MRSLISRTAVRSIFAIAIISMSASSCHWLRYHDLARTHVDLMERIANDVGAALRIGEYRLKPGDLQTMAYPLERAMAFLEESSGRRGHSASRQRLEEFVGAYQELYEYLDRVRTIADEERRIKKVDALIAMVNEKAAATRAALDEETG